MSQTQCGELGQVHGAQRFCSLPPPTLSVFVLLKSWEYKIAGVNF